MQTLHALVQRNIRRASHTLPFLDPALRDIIDVIPSLLAEGTPAIGIYEHPPCTRKEYDLLQRLLDRKPEILVGRLHYRVMLDSLIVLLRPCFAGPHRAGITLVCMARPDAPEFDLKTKLFIMSALFRREGIPFSPLVFRGPLPQFLVYEVMRTGIVLGGKEPVTEKDSSSDLGIYIGELPGIITQAGPVPSAEWNPFETYLDSRVEEFISRGDYPSVLQVPGANPYILPYLHILHHHEEQGDADEVDKIRTSLLTLFSPFPPTAEALGALGKTWKMKQGLHNPAKLGFTDAMRMRIWLVPVEKNELPVFCWPLPPRFELGRAELKINDGFWGLDGIHEFRHAYPWVVLAWATLAGLIGPSTRVAAPRSLGLKRGCEDLLLEMLEAVSKGADLLVPHDPAQGSVSVRNGRFFFSPKPFAILEKGRKHSVELFEMVKKKTLIDDYDLKDKLKK
jgi:hypothetical protein